MNRSFRAALIVAAAAATLALTACQQASHGDHSSLPPTPAATDQSDQPERNDRGNLVNAMGQEAGFTSPSGDTQATFTVDSVVLDPACDSPLTLVPTNGHFLQVNVRVSTTAALISPLVLTQYQFQVIGPDGVTENASQSVDSAMCLPTSAHLPSNIGPAQQASGAIMLDTAHTTGTLVVTMPGVSGGWEWQF